MATVSVCIPTFNYGRFLPQAIDSVLGQTFADLELLVVDNCSTDDTVRIVGEFARRDARLRYFRNARNLGICANFNRALELARGDYVKILCADDWLAPRALELSVAALEQNPGAALVTTGRLLIPQEGGRGGFESYCYGRRTFPGHAVINRCFFGTNYVGEPSAVLFRRRLASRGFDERYPQLLDMEMWFHLLEQGALVCLPQPLTMIRVHGTQLTREHLRAGQIVKDKKRLFSVYGGKPYIARTRWNMLVWRLRTAYNLWSATPDYNQAERRAALREFVPPSLFYLLLPLLIALVAARAVVRRLQSIAVEHMAMPKPR